ncbi:MAG TPA: beta-ketoacyl-ACP synthase II [Candidatus Eremiobacteraceae bacterium]|nr:beta-ketoacyl-ACP synthase II [Candidatus Eremiobacteraceae bacterium]
MGSSRRVVVTGLGAVSPLGNTVPEFWANAIAGKNGIGPITHFDPRDLPTRFAGEVRNFDASELVGKKDSRRMDRFAQFAVVAAREAVTESGLQITDENRDRIGVIVASGIGGILTLEDQHSVLLERGPDRVSPFFIPMLMGNSAPGQISIAFDVHGPSQTTVSACASSNNALGDAYRLIEHGDADAVISGGAEAAITPLAVAGFCSMKALSTRNDDPASASRPFDLDRDGFVLAEGGGALLLEELDFAKKRGAHIYAEIIGYGQSSDAHHIATPDPSGRGVRLAIERALADAGCTPDDVDYINAHATSTGLGDTAEVQACAAVFGARSKTLPISANKSMFGHSLGAAGALEGICTVLALRDGVLPPTINYHTKDPLCDIDCVPNVARKASPEVALSNSFGFGGHNAVLVFRAYSG